MARLTIAAQCSLGKGGTWDGIQANLKNNWNPVCLFSDHSAAALELQNRGAQLITAAQLENLAALMEQTMPFIL